jgi:hypothetical protein
MLIRKEQMAVMGEHMRRQFENRVLVHLEAKFPGDCKALGEEAVRASIRKGMARAEHYGLATELNVMRYIDLMYTLNPDFDTDTAIPWAERILNDPELDSRSKVDELEVRAREQS